MGLERITNGESAEVFLHMELTGSSHVFSKQKQGIGKDKLAKPLILLFKCYTFHHSAHALM